MDNKNKGGKAKLIITSFSEEYINWENIFIEGDEKIIKENVKDINQKESSENLSSKLAVIIYGNNLNKEWLGVENGEQEYLEGRDRYAVFSLKEEKNMIKVFGVLPFKKIFYRSFDKNIFPIYIFFTK